MDVNLQFTHAGSNNIASGTWTSDSESGNCSGTIEGQSGTSIFNIFGGGDSNNPSSTTTYIVVCGIFLLCTVTAIILIFIVITIVRRNKTILTAAPGQNQMLQPVTLPPTEPAIYSKNNIPAPAVRTEANKTGSPKTIKAQPKLGPKRPGYFKKQSRIPSRHSLPEIEKTKN
jgi:hypothetical protein